MDISTTTSIERIARTLAGIDHSANGTGTESSAATSVDETWRAYLAQADAVLRTIREPSEAMASVGAVATWSAMIEAAIRESEQI